jgi:Wax ester synthase/diacylglycerol acyltransferase catalytic domain
MTATRTLDRMSTLDAEFFYAEHHNVPMHIGSVAVFDGPAPTRQDLMRLFEAKLPRVPRYRQQSARRRSSFCGRSGPTMSTSPSSTNPGRAPY